MDKLSERLLAVSAKYGMAYDDAEVMEAAAKLARRVEEAPVGHVDQAVAADAVVVDELDLSDWRLRGQRVRLVMEQES